MAHTHHINLVVLHDVDTVRAAVEQALAHADEAERPGLRRALTIIDEARADDGDLKVRWARRYLADAGVPAGDTGTGAIRALRQAVPGLGLAEAVELVQLAAR
jgi:hypothetical protein